MSPNSICDRAGCLSLGRGGQRLDGGADDAKNGSEKQRKEYLSLGKARDGEERNTGQKGYRGTSYVKGSRGSWAQ